MKKLGLLLLFFVAAIIFVPHQTFAASKSTGLKIFPLRARPTQRPGDTSTGSISIKNDSPLVMQVVLSVEKFKVINENYDYSFSPGDNTNWIRLADKKVTLSSGETKNIAYSVATPIDAPPGGYYFSILASTENIGGPTTFKEVKRVASQIYLEVSGKIVKKVNLLGVDSPWFTTKRSVSADFRLDNQGNSHYPARVKQDIQNIIGQRTEPTIKEGLILPATIRKLNSKLTMPWLPGIYRLNLEFSPPQGGEVQNVSQNIFYFPVWAWVTSLLVLILLVWRIFGRRFNLSGAQRYKRPR